MGVPGGAVLDPTSTIADAQRFSAVSATIDASSNLVAAASTGLSNALARLDAVAVKTNEFSGRIYIAADMDEDPGFENVYGSTGPEYVETNGTLHYLCHFSRELTEAPRTRWAFDIAPGVVLWSDGTAATNNATTNVLGVVYYDIRVEPPAGVGNVVLRVKKPMKIGAPGFPLDIDDAGITLIKAGTTNDAFTGSVTYTNAVGSISNVVIESWLSGTLYQMTTNSIGGAQ